MRPRPDMAPRTGPVNVAKIPPDELLYYICIKYCTKTALYFCIFPLYTKSFEKFILVSVKQRPRRPNATAMDLDN